MLGFIVIFTHALGVFQTITEATIEKGICESRKCKRIHTQREQNASFLIQTQFFPIACHPPPPPTPAGKRAVKIKSLSSNCSLPEEYSPKHLCWTISWGLAQTFGILHAGREKPPGIAFLKGPLSLPCSSDQLHTPPLDPAHLWGKMLPTNGQVTKKIGC